MFGLSVKGKYGISAMLELGLQQHQGPIQIKTLAEKRNLPQNYLEQVMVELKRAGLVQSFRGSQGGYALAKPTENISTGDILECLEGPCQLSSSNCNCETLNSFWKEAETHIGDYFKMPLSKLIDAKLRETASIVYTI